MFSSKHKQPTNTTNNHNIHTHANFFSQKNNKINQLNDRKFISSPKHKQSKHQEKQIKEITHRQNPHIEKSESKRQSHFLRKTIMQLYKFFECKKQNWNLNLLSYSQILVLLKQLKFIKFSEQNEQSQNNQQLRKCYFIWLNLSQGGRVRLTNIIILLTHIEKIQCDCQLIEEVVTQLEKGIQKFGVPYNQLNHFPTFLFICKKQAWNFQNGLLKLTDKQIAHAQKYFSSFLYTRLTQNEIKINLQYQDEHQNYNFMSKKSVELADSKRKKILQQIKLRQPNMQYIELYHILNFKQKGCNQKEKPMKTEAYQPINITEKTKGNHKRIQKVKTNPTTQTDHQQIKNNKYKNKENISYQTKVANQKHFTSNLNPKQNLKKKSNKDLISKNNSQYKQHHNRQKRQIQDELLQEPIPHHTEVNSFQKQFFHFKQDSLAELLAPQSSQLTTKQNKIKQQKRRDYIELPILYVDVNVEQGKKQRIIVYQGDKASQLAIQFGKIHNLNQQTIGRLQIMLQQQIGSVLCKIDQAFEQDCSYLYQT